MILLTMANTLYSSLPFVALLCGRARTDKWAKYERSRVLNPHDFPLLR